jgi:hypothetical protein
MRLPTVGGTGRASFKLFSVALLIHDGTLLTMRRWNRSTTETTCRPNIFAGFPSELLTSGATSERTRNLRTAGFASYASVSTRLSRRFAIPAQTRICVRRSIAFSRIEIYSVLHFADCQREQRRWSWRHRSVGIDFVRAARTTVLLRVIANC